MEEIKMEMTDEVKDKLKNILGFSIDTPFKYVSKVFRDNDIPKDLWAVFTLKSKNGIEIAEEEDDAGRISLGEDMNSREWITKSGTTRLKTLRKGIVKVDNFITEDNRIVSWSKGKDVNVNGSKIAGAGVDIF